MRSLANIVAVCEDAACNPSVRCVWPPSDDVHRQGLLFHDHDDLMMELQRDSIKPDESGQNVQMNCVYIRMYTATRIVCVCTGILALLTVVGGYSCTITQIYFNICCACLYYSYGSFKHKCEFCEIHACS